MSSDQESKWRPFGLQGDAQPPEPQQSPSPLTLDQMAAGPTAELSGPQISKWKQSHIGLAKGTEMMEARWAQGRADAAGWGRLLLCPQAPSGALQLLHPSGQAGVF